MKLLDKLLGAKAIVDGFGKSPPPRELAQKRSDICTKGFEGGKPCPYNYLGAWSITSRIAEMIHKQREIKLQLKLQVDGEEKLGVCEVCGCPMMLKVWYDAETIWNHTSDAAYSKYPSWCWLQKEKPQHPHK